MRALPVRRIALGACCAALLVGITGPVATAADPVRERTPASSDALLVQVRSLDAQRGELAPVVDLLEAVLEADGGHLPPAEARKLGGAAEDALEKAAAKARAATAAPATTAPVTTDTPDASDPGTTTTITTSSPTATPEASVPAEDTPLVVDETVLADDLLDAVREVVDDLQDLLLSGEEDVVIEDLLAEVEALVDELLGTADPQVSTLPAPVGTTPVTQVPLLPVSAPLTLLFLPTS
ncbi:hypothetical protein [Streptomyces viridosporus]|uniref:Secreted protein n=1 Tax=Streptomyces viridosporus T7A TaxID=665577 RepID=A0ABX6AFM9_STRVD|nr:hypothetical protein [Streptomyces viridosporus]QEU85824.1 hypothetical protein CP969_14735 [Streptomyces viridosporus T7A]